MAAALASYERVVQRPAEAAPRVDALAARTPRTGEPAAVAKSLATCPSVESAGALATQIRGAAANAEEAGALLLAREMLSDLSELVAHAPPVERGMILIQLGRVARTLGELDTAQDFVRAAGDIGRSTGTPELEAREVAAQAVLARVRGNHPAARSLFQQAAERGEALGLADVAGQGHQGLMIELAEVKDFDNALRHGWQALSAARTQQSREAEMLVNLAQLCADAGYDAAALGAFAAALARTSAPRLRLPTLAGVATAAGRLGDMARLAEAERRIATEASDAFPFETARAWLAVAHARRSVSDEAAADAAARKAAVIAKAHGFHEVVHRVEQEVRPARAALSPTSLDVIRSLETWSDSPSIGSAVSSATRD
jgi:tetratricopeptide (TPR) repeat protein